MVETMDNQLQGPIAPDQLQLNFKNIIFRVKKKNGIKYVLNDLLKDS